MQIIIALSASIVFIEVYAVVDIMILNFWPCMGINIVPRKLRGWHFHGYGLFSMKLLAM